MSQPHKILYDSECGFCRWTLAWFLRWDRHGRLEPVRLQDPEAQRLLGAVPEERRMASWHLVDPSGRVESAGGAIAPLLRLLPAGGAPARIVDRMPRVARRAYRWSADHRGGLGKLVTAGARERADAVIERRRRRSQSGLS